MMKSRLKRNWTGLGLLTLACAGGVAAYCYFTPDCLLASKRHAASSNSSVNTRPIRGEKTMLTEIQNTVVHANEKTFRQEVLNSKVPVLVDFYADWCGPCRALGPVLEELAQETPDAKIVKVNVDDSPQLAGQYGVSSIPNLLVFKDGRVVDQQVGLASKAQLKSLLVE
jgi:thioredoxin 1